MPQYGALDVSNAETTIHVIDETGAVIWRGKRASDPDVLTTTLRRYAPDLVRVGLETGPLTPWLYQTCKALGLPIVCLDARHARAATALQRNKTDARDAETLAQLVRMGWYREARVKSYAAHAVCHLVGARAQRMGVAIDLSNQIRSTLKTFGLMAGKGAGRAFENRVTELIEARPTIAAIVEPLLAAWRAVRGQIGVLDRRPIALAKGDATCGLLMTCPGVGVIVATSFAAAIEAPEHFRHSRSVGANLGLTPARHQSGEVDRIGGISRRGDRLMRTYLFEAAASLLVRVRGDSALKTWGRALVERLGFKHAAVAVARKLAVVLHAMWQAGTPFQPWPVATA
ncbi:IS110 family transposase [Methylorubrum sp. GM97]|uniref:IS110 family transposase n=1 Tax=Methylorubrum sp. GM97 TaxID=2938232 RepID=UPI00218C8339|nr:IS110 family transposase [Methylorubrum sp. GM97]BDL41778.1 IS110 family transposase [Methylorubrum sp. GM97]